MRPRPFCLQGRVCSCTSIVKLCLLTSSTTELRRRRESLYLTSSTTGNRLRLFHFIGAKNIYRKKELTQAFDVRLNFSLLSYAYSQDTHGIGLILCNNYTQTIRRLNRDLNLLFPAGFRLCDL